MCLLKNNQLTLFSEMFVSEDEIVYGFSGFLVIQPIKFLLSAS